MNTKSKYPVGDLPQMDKRQAVVDLSQTHNTLSPPAFGDLQQIPNGEQYLSLLEISERLQVSYQRLRGFADAPGMKAALGAVDLPGVQGVRYPALAEQKFALLLEAQQAKLVKPSTATAFLEKTRLEPGTPFAESTDLVATSPAVHPQFAEVIAQAIRAALPPPPDRLLTGKEAAALLSCSVATLRKKVRAVERGRWRESDILKYIQGLVASHSHIIVSHRSQVGGFPDEINTAGEYPAV